MHVDKSMDTKVFKFCDYVMSTILSGRAGE